MAAKVHNGAVGRCQTMTRHGVLSLLAIVCAASLAVCSAGDGVAERDSAAPAEPDGGPGTEITVSGPIGQVLDAYVFEVGKNDGEPVIVVALRGVGGMASGTEVDVTGTVDTFDVARIERRIGARLKPELNRFNGRPCLIARRIVARQGPG